MQVLFLPIYYEFTMTFEHFFVTPALQKATEPTPEEFFQNKALANELLSFFENLPKSFKNFFCLLHEFLQVKNPNDHSSSSTALCGLLINRFLFSPGLKMMADPDIVRNSPYLKVANFFKDLFYSKNLTAKYTQIPQFHQLCSYYVKVLEQV